MKKEYELPNIIVENVTLEDIVLTSSTTGQSPVEDINNFFDL